MHGVNRPYSVPWAVMAGIGWIVVRFLKTEKAAEPKLADGEDS